MRKSIHNYDRESEIKINDLLILIWSNKLKIVFITLFFSLGAVIFSLSQPNFYKSQAVLTLSGGSSNSNVISSNNGLATMMGLNLPQNGQNRATLVIETIKSRSFLNHLISIEGVLPALFASKSYDKSTRKIIFDEELYEEKTKKWTRDPKNKKGPKPSYLETHEKYIEQVHISHDERNNLLSISVEHVSPVFAKDFLDLIILQTNELLRAKDLRESSEAISFLTSEIPKSSLVSMKDAINQLVQSKLETQMMARISNDYILKIIDPPYVPELKSKPNRSLISIMGFLFGVLFSLMWILIEYLYKSKKFRLYHQ